MDKIINLDLKDKKLLYELDFNARMSNSEMSKKIYLSKQGVEYKINSLIEKGVIKGFYPVINLARLGFIYCRLFLVLQNTDEEKEKEIIKYTVNQKNISWIFTTQGNYDLLIGIWVKSIKEFKEIVEDLILKYGKYIKSKNESIVTELIHYQSRYLLDVSKGLEINIKETQEKVKIDDVDIEILKALCDDARSHIVTIAQKLNLSSKIVSYRIKKLENEKLIEAYRPIIDHNKIAYTYYKLFINLHYENSNDLLKVYNYIKTKPELVYIIKAIGMDGDLDIELMLKNNLELYEFIKDLKNKFPKLIGNYKTLMFIENKKVRFLPF